MGKRDRGKKKKVSKGQLKRQREQKAKQDALKKADEERKQAEALKNGVTYTKKVKKDDVSKNEKDFTLNVREDQQIKEWTRDIMIQNFTMAPVGGGTPLISRADLRIIHGTRYGLIGKNGAGKTTLLRHIEKKEFAGFPAHLRVHLVQQEMESTDFTVIETVMNSDVELTALKAEKTEINRMFDLIEELEKKARDALKEERLPGLESRKRELESRLGEARAQEKEQFTNPEGMAEAKMTEEEKPDDDLVVVTALDALQAKLDEVNAEIAALDTVKIEDTPELASTRKESEKVPPMRLAEIDERLHYLDADQAENRASEVLDGLNFTDRMKNMKLSDLSGGWRMRVALACGLFIEPDVLLLDEPTNHLDFPAVKWLSEYLAVYNPDKSLIIVSHERDFLNEVCDSIIHLQRCRLKYYKGNYDQFETTRAELRHHQSTQYKKQQREIAHQEDFIRRFAANKKWSTQAQSRRKQLAKMKRIEAVYNESNWRFKFPEPEKLRNKLLLEIEEMGFTYFANQKKSQYLLRDINVRMNVGKKIGIIGANGAGKSTLLKLIRGVDDLMPTEGKCFMRNEIIVGYFAQHHLETIDMDATPLQFLRHEYPSTSVQECFAKLGRFNIPAKKAQKPIGLMSGGEKSRLAFAILTWYNPQLVIMDEPTNHLDLSTQDALIEALKEFTGSLLVVSHDRHMLTSCCNEFWVVGNQTLTAFDNFDEASHFCYKKCKKVEILPREFSTVATKKNKKIPEHLKKMNAEEIILGASGPPKPAEKSDEFEFTVDLKRELRKAIDKGLAPEKYLIHLKGWKPVDGDPTAVNIVVFDMMNKFFSDPEYSDVDVFEFFESYVPLIKFLLPDTHIRNQHKLLCIVTSCWFISFGDNFARAVEEDALENIFECVFQYGYVTDEALLKWKEADPSNTVGREESLKILDSWFKEADLQAPDVEVKEEESAI